MSGSQNNPQGFVKFRCCYWDDARDPCKEWVGQNGDACPGCLAKGRPSKRDQRVTQALSRQIAAPHIEAGGVHYVIKPSSGAKDHLAGVKASLPPGPYDFELLWRPSPPRGLTLGRQSHLSGGNNQDCTIEDVPYTCV